MWKTKISGNPVPAPAHRCVQFTCLLLLLTGLLQTVPSAAAANSAGLAHILEVQGKVEVARAGSGDWDLAYTNQVLRAGDRYRTGERSQLLLLMHDRTHLRVQERSQFTIQAPEQSDGSIIVNLLRGVAYFFGRDRPDKVEIRTRTAVAAVRGTEFVVMAEEDGRLVVQLIDGVVDLSNPLGSRRLTSGQHGVAPIDGPPALMINIPADIQWLLYYPAVLSLDELDLTPEQINTLAQSLVAYTSGDLASALQLYPVNRDPHNDAERAYLAMLYLSIGSTDRAGEVLEAAGNDSPSVRAVQELMAVVQGVDSKFSRAPLSASEWLAFSIRQQREFKLELALASAQRATDLQPNFGFAWARVAELEFSFGRSGDAKSALDRALALAPRHAQALALLGFIQSARGDLAEAESVFDQAIATDGRLANAWLGRGLVRIRRGERAAGLADLQMAAVMEPNRPLLRSYLGKAFGHAGELELALHELELARKRDKSDPTPWLYEGLLRRQQNEVNTALRDLEESIALNKNRRLYRSRLLLDQDQAVRSGHLAGVYLDLEMQEASVREASRAVDYDYSNYSAHQFLAQSFNALRDPRQINLRYETPAFTEYLLANLLSPPGAGTLSQNISQNEYAKLFEQDGAGVSSETQYLSGGDWRQNASQFGHYGSFGYALDVFYQSENGQRPNNDLEQVSISLATKFEVSAKDQLLLLASWYDYESGDVSPRYDPADAQMGLRVREVQEPLLTAGWLHRWNQEHVTLALFNHADDTLNVTDPAQSVLLLGKNAAQQVTLIASPTPPTAALDYESRFRLFSGEVQHIWETARHNLIVGGRLQSGTFDSSCQLGASTVTQLSAASRTNPVPGFYSTPALQQDETSTMNRVSGYADEKWKIWEPFQLIAGVAYDHIEFPINHRNSPLSAGEDSRDQLSPKAGFNYEPLPGTVLRGAYSRFLGGVSLDQSIRLEPVQVAGFNQAYRSLIPDAIAGAISAPEFETCGLAWDQHFRTTGTYLGVRAELLRSNAERMLGVFDQQTFFPLAVLPSATPQSLDFEERDLHVTLNQLIGRDWVFNARYQLSDARLDSQFPAIPVAVTPAANTRQEATLHELGLGAVFNHPSGFFGSGEAVWYQQSNRGYTPDLPGDDFWHFNVFAGYRFLNRRAEIRVGVLNLTDQDYRLNPLNLHSELRRTRTFVAGLKLQF